MSYRRPPQSSATSDWWAVLVVLLIGALLSAVEWNRAPHDGSTAEQRVPLGSTVPATASPHPSVRSQPTPSVPATVPASAQGQVRGYMTTPLELRAIAAKAQGGREPYATAVEEIIDFAGEPESWPYGSITGSQKCKDTLQPKFVGRGAPLIYAKALAYRLTGDERYAETIRDRVLELTRTTGYGGDTLSGKNQCILNLSWYLPSWIMAADLIEDWDGWQTDDRRSFQRWLADEVYAKVSWASHSRSNNWGSAGSATAAMIADYMWDSGLELDGEAPGMAFQVHKQNQLDRMNAMWQGDSRCDSWGIQPYGGIPDELRRGASGCDATVLKKLDASWTYTQTHLEGIVMHAELLLRRGDESLYRNIQDDGSGSLLRAIHFVIANPRDRQGKAYWKDNHKPTLEVTYRFYRDAPSAEELGVGTEDRFIGGKSGQMLHFGTITHGFAPDEDPEPPITVASPQLDD